MKLLEEEYVSNYLQVALYKTHSALTLKHLLSGKRDFFSLKDQSGLRTPDNFPLNNVKSGLRVLDIC